MSNFLDNEQINLPPEICAAEENSFARYTLINRFPHIIEQIICDNDYESIIIKKLRRLSDEVFEGKISPLEKTGYRDSEIWENCVENHQNKSWFEAPFFFVEMYFYRRILETVGYFDANNAEERDPFLLKKTKSFYDSLAQIEKLAEFLNSVYIGEKNQEDKISESLELLILANLWSNRADLSQLPKTLRSGESDSQSKTNLLINDSSRLTAHIINNEESLQRIDIILDNAGIELISDLALADFLVMNNLVSQVILHCKRHPLFVSDARMTDVLLVIKEMRHSNQTDIQKWGQRLAHLIEQRSLIIHNNSFWTLPLYFREMPIDMLADISESDLLISKGDANYRRLLDDRHWDISTPVDQIINYLPTYCLALRVLKSEILSGVNLEKLKCLDLKEDWMTNGSYGIVQFIAPSV